MFVQTHSWWPSHLKLTLTVAVSMFALCQSPRFAFAEQALGETPNITAPSAEDAHAGLRARMPWLHEGATLTYTQNVLVTDQALNPDRDGGLTDPETGRHYKPGDRSGTSVGGWTEDTITAIDGEKAVVLMNFFADDRLLGAADPMPQIGGLSLPSPLVGGNAGDAWIDPARLASMKSNPAIGTVATSLAWKAGNRTIDAVRLAIVSDHGSTDCIYDLQTGLELQYFECSQKRPANVVGQLTSDEKNWFVTWGDLIGLRDVHVPWSDEPMPESARNLKAMHYTGAMLVHGMYAHPQPYTYDVTRTASGKNWALTQNATQLSKSPFVYGNTQFGGLWAGPAALAKLEQNQVLDEDPLSHVKTFVKKAGGGSVVISRANANSVMDFQYDTRTGLLTASDIYDGMTHQEYAMKLQARE